MAEDVPFVQSVGLQDETGRSRGFSSSGASTLFEGLNQAVANVVPAADRAVKHNIQEEIRGGVSQIFEDFVGVNRKTEGGPNISARESMPADAKRDLESIGRLRRKWEAGKISSTHLHTAAAALAKKVKTRYGGYAAEVDAALRGHGFTPANDILREHQAAQSAAKASGRGTADAVFKSNLRTLDWVMKKGILSAKDRELILSNPSAAASNAELMGRIRVNASNEMAKESNLDQRSKLLSIQAAEGKLDEKMAKSTLTHQVFGKIFDSVRATGVTARFDEAQKELIAQSKAGGVPKAETINEIRAAWGEFKANIVKNKNEIYASSSWATKSPEAMREVNALVDNYISTTEKALFSGDTNMLKSATAFLDNLNNQNEVDLNKESRTFGRIKALNSALGPGIAQWLVTNNPQGLTMAEKFLADSINADIAERKYDTVYEALNAAKNGQGMTGKTADTVLGTIQSVFSQSESDPALVKRLYESMFSRENERLLTSLDPKKREEVNRFLISPRTQKIMKEYVDKGVLSRGDMAGYASYVARAYMITAKDDIEEAQKVSQIDRNFFIQFDSDKNQYVVSERKNVPPARTVFGAIQEKGVGLTAGDITGAMTDAIRTNSRSTVEGLVSRLNGRIEPLAGIFKSSGTDPARILPSLVGVPVKGSAGDGRNNLGLDDIRPEGTTEQDRVPSDIVFRTFQAQPELATGPNQTLYRNIVATGDTKALVAFNKYLTDPGNLSDSEIEMIAEKAVTGQMNAAEGNNLEVEELKGLYQDALNEGDEKLAKQVKENITTLILDDTSASVKEMAPLRKVMKINILNYLRTLPGGFQETAN